MTRVEGTRTIVRQVSTPRSGELILKLAPEGVYLREKGRRKGYLLPYGVAFLKAAQLEADRARAEKTAAKRERAKLRRAGR